MMTQDGHHIIYTRNHRTVRIAQSAPADRVRALMLSGISESVANIFVFANGHRTAVVQLAQRVGLTQ